MFTIDAPAKINWFLNVLHLREDGFHEIESLVQKVTLFDTLAFKPGENISLHTNTDIPQEQNLVFKAAMLLKSIYDVNFGADITLEKNIPMGAGLGGGSSDAASALLGLNELWSLGLSADELCRIAAQLGSDVPFFLNGPVAFMRGRGEKITPAKALKKWDVLIVKPSFNISTAWAYKEFARYKNAIAEKHNLSETGLTASELTNNALKVNNIGHFIRKIERADWTGLRDAVTNDLELVAVRKFPVISEIKQKMYELGAVFSIMSGSGSAVYGIFETPAEAEKASGSFEGLWTAVAETIIK